MLLYALGGGGRAFPVGRGGANVVPSNLTAGAGGVGGCLRCHGADLHGRPGRNFFAADISHGGLASWSAADFTTAMRTGCTPDGRLLAEPMPWHAIGRLTDAELARLPYRTPHPRREA